MFFSDESSELPLAFLHCLLILFAHCRVALAHDENGDLLLSFFLAHCQPVTKGRRYRDGYSRHEVSGLYLNESLDFSAK